MSAPESAPQPLVTRHVTATATLVETPAAFMALLRGIHKASGLTAGQIAASSGLPRSTAYRFVNHGNNTLPKHRDQVLAFLRACRRPDVEIHVVLGIWEKLSGHAAVGSLEARIRRELPDYKGAATRPRTDHPVPTKPSSSLDLKLSDPNMRRILVDHLGAIGKSATQQAIAAESEYLRLLPQDITAITHDLPSNEATEPSSANSLPDKPPNPLGATSWAFRNFVLGMLALTLYPVATSVWFGSRFTTEFTRVMFLAAAVVVLFSTSIWIRQLRHTTSMLSAPRVAAAALIALCAGCLAWAASPTPSVGLLTGLTVFTTAPIWLSFTRFTGLDTGRGSFVLMTSALFGATLGFMAALTKIPAPGAMLTGIIGTAAAVMLLSNKVLD